MASKALQTESLGRDTFQAGTFWDLLWRSAKYFLASNMRVIFYLRSRQTRFLSLIQRSDYTKVLLYLNHICPRLLEHIQSERSGGGAGISAPPMYLGVGLG